MRSHGNEREDSNPHALRCNTESPSFETIFQRDHWSLNPSLCAFFPKSKNWRKNQRSRQFCNKVDIEIKIKIDRIRQRYNAHQNIVRIIRIS